MSTIAIYGAGPALGMAVARRFGREGFHVALVARNRGHLDAMVAELAGEGIEAAGFPADVSDRGEALKATDAIEARLGPVDVLEFSPTPAGDRPRPAPSQLDAITTAGLLDKYVLTPVALVQRVLPGMLERGDGGLLFAMGASAKYPMPGLAGGLAIAALRNYAHTLHAELASKGVYAGTLLIGALIENSAAHRDSAAWSANTGQRQLAVVTAGELANLYWDMYVKRDRPEDEVAPGLSAAGAS